LPQARKSRRRIKKRVGFYDGQVGKINRLKGFVMINNFEDKQKAVNILFWEIIDNMDNYYTNDKN
jgi:hypothetical protein